MGKIKNKSSHLADISNVLCCTSKLFCCHTQQEWGSFSRLGPTSPYGAYLHLFILLGKENMGKF